MTERVASVERPDLWFLAYLALLAALFAAGAGGLGPVDAWALVAGA